MKHLWINEDNASFYDYRSQNEMSVEGLNSLVDTYADNSSVEGVLFCVNVQRALFDSKAWQPLFDGYDPEGPDDQPMFEFLNKQDQAFVPGNRGRWWVHNLWLLAQRGLDHPQIWVDRCRHHQIEGWLTMRMNDCHHNPAPTAFWHSSLWQERPDLHRAAYRDEGWFETAFDYGKPEVVAHHMALLRELCERYDVDGIELDWVRWIKNFRPGGEVEGLRILNDFMREARTLTKSAAKRLGHPVKLGVRLPTRVQDCVAWGYDLYTWAKEGLVDQIILAPFLSQSCFEFEIPLWKALFGDKVKIIAQSDNAMHTWPDAGPITQVHDYKLLWGSAAAAFEEGADGIAIFNECYRVNPGGRATTEDPTLVRNLLEVTGDSKRLRDWPRRQALSYHQSPGPGMGISCVLPVPLRRPNDSFDMGRYRESITFRVPLGQKPETLHLCLRIGLDEAGLNTNPADFTVWINGHEISTLETEDPANAPKLPKTVKGSLISHLSPETCLDGINIVEVLPPQVDGQIVWLEIELDETI